MDGSGDGSNRDATPRFVVFGRTPDTVASLPATTGQVTPPPAPPAAPGPPPRGAACAAWSTPADSTRGRWSHHRRQHSAGCQPGSGGADQDGGGSWGRPSA